MAFNLALPPIFRNARWKVKIRDKESREPPHVTIIRGTKAWRINLRTGEFIDAVPDPDEIPEGLVELLAQEATWQQLRDEWDQMYPDNPVSGGEDE